MKKLTVLILAILLISTAVFAKKAKYEIKFASVAPDGSTWMNVMEDLNDTIMEKTNGEVKFKFYPGGVSGDERDVLKKMKINQLHSGAFTSQGLGEIVPETRILNLPLMIKTDEEVDYIMKKMGKELEDKFNEKGFIVLGWAEVGFVYVLSTEKVESIADMKKLKMWIWGDDKFVNSLFKNLGVVPIPLSLIDVMQSLQTGLIEGVYGSPLAAVATQWTTKVKYLLDLKIAHVPGGILVTENKWKKIPKEYQDIIKKESKKAFKNLTKLSRKENDEALEVMKSQGIKFTKISAADDIKVFEGASAKTSLELIDKFYSKELLEELEGHLKDFRSKNSK